MRRSAYVGTHNIRAASRRLSSALVDQGLSSTSNFIFSLLAARTLGIRGLGVITLVLGWYLIALGVSRSVASEPYVVRHSAETTRSAHLAHAEAAGAASAVGVLMGTALVAASFLLPSAGRGPAIAIGLSLPFLLMQDAWRFIFFAQGRGWAAVLNDLVWVGILLLALPAAISAGTPSAFAKAWSASGAAAGLFGIWQARTWPKPRSTGRWLRTHRDLAPRYVGEFVAVTGSSQLALYGIGALAGLSAVGSLRAAQLLLGPLNVLFMAAALFAVPEAVRRAKGQEGGSLLGFCLKVSASLSISAFVWGGVVLLLPDALGELLFRDSWGAARPLALFVMLAYAGSGALSGALVGLRGQADARRSFRGRLIYAPVILAGALLGVSLGGASGAAAGLAVSTLFGTFVFWRLLLKSVRGERVEGAVQPQEAPSLNET